MKNVRPGRGRADAAQHRQRVSVSTLFAEAVSGLTQRPSRSVLTTMGTVLGIGAFVAVLGITTTANGQITEQFNELVATQVTVKQADGREGRSGLLFPGDSEERVEKLHGVEHAGLKWNPANISVSKFAPGIAPDQALSEAEAPVIAVSAGFWDVVHPKIAAGRTFDTYLMDQPVALMGEDLAKQLGVTDLAQRPVLFLSGRPFTVIGLVSSSSRVDDPATSISIPTHVAQRYFGDPRLPAEMTVETDLGAAPLVARDAPLALDPIAPDHFVSIAPIDPNTLQNNVSQDLRSLFLALAGISLFVGAVGIANANLLAVMERIPEIGLRRSLGALPRHIGSQFLIESTILGSFGGVLGSVLGVMSVIGVSLVRTWTPVIEPLTVVAAPLLGAVVGMLAGLYPSLRASRVDPVEAFRR